MDHSNTSLAATAAASESSAKIWSEYQQAVFAEIADGEGHLVVIARAGCAKTTTILEGMHHVPAGCTVFLAAFSKDIATELQTRAPKGVEVKTLHAYGMRAVAKKFGQLRVDSQRVANLARAIVGNDDETVDLRKALCKVAGLAKGCLASSRDEVDALMDAFGVDDGDVGDRSRFIKDVLTLLDWCKTPYTLAQPKSQKNWNGAWVTFQSKEAVIDFDDMVWLPVVHDLRVWQFDRVFIDETQDLNRAQIRLALKACKSNGRIVAVGDDRQAIYAFRGADHEAIGNIVSELDAKVLHLPRTYRCGKAIVALAQTIVPDFEAASSNPEGKITTISEQEMLKNVRVGDFILSRTNAPLIGYCLRLIREGRRANIQGRDIGASLAAFVKKSGKKDVETLREYVESWRNKEIVRLQKKDAEANTQIIDDKADTILALSEHSKSVAELLGQIETLFADDEKSASGLNKIVLSTTHKAKGLERERVFVLESTFRREGRNGQGASVEESNLFYVAITRARESLFLVPTPRSPRRGAV